MSERWDRLRRWGWRILRITAVIGVVGGAIYWLRLSPVKVTEHRVSRGQIVAEVLGTGTLEARVETTVSPKISGRIAEILVDQGDRVKINTVLVRLDDEELRQQVAIAQANVEAAQAAIVRLKSDKVRTIAVAEQARKSHARIEALSAKNAITQDEMDKATESLAISQADVSRAEAAITEAQNELVAAEKTLEYHRARLADTEVKAPFEGLIVKRHRDPGDVVVPGSAILTLISTDELWISAWVDETEMAKLSTDQTARVVFRSEPDRSYSGKVVRLGREADRETREFIVDVRVLELPENWAVGQRAESFIEVARKDNVVSVPGKFVIVGVDGPGVFVSSNGRSVWRQVQLGLRSRESVEILEGLNADEIVVVPVDTRMTLSDGRSVVTP